MSLVTIWLKHPGTVTRRTRPHNNSRPFRIPESSINSSLGMNRNMPGRFRVEPGTLVYRSLRKAGLEQARLTFAS